MTLHFKSKQQISVEEYIAKAKKLSIFDPRVEGHVVWDSATWDITAFVKRIRNSKGETVGFHHADRQRSRANDPEFAMNVPFGDFAKAYFAFQLNENATKTGKFRKSNVFSHKVKFCRILDRVLESRGHPGRADLIAKSDLNKVVELASKSHKRKAAETMRSIARVLEGAGIAHDLKSWWHPELQDKRFLSRVNEYSLRKNLTEEEVSCLGEAFHRAKTPRDQVAMGIVALLMCAPSRKEEVFILPAKVQALHNPGEGYANPDVPFNEDCRFKAGLRWWPVKGGKPMIKFVPKEMVPVAQLALERICEHTERARKLAKWMMENPGRVFVPTNLQHVRATGEITRSELEEFLGVGGNYWLQSRRILAAKYRACENGKPIAVYDFAQIEEKCLAEAPHGLPVLSELSSVAYSEALCVCLKNQFAHNTEARPYMIEALSSGVVELVLSGRPESLHKSGHTNPAVPSIFERFDIRLKNGKYPKITTHQMRHYLNTMAQRANVPQSHIAYWSGRANVMQNRNYDHTDKLYQVEQIKRSGEDENLPAIRVVDDSDVENAAYETANLKMHLLSTLFGYCNRRFNQEPCDRAGACRTCTRLVCLGGSKRAADLLLRDAERDQKSLETLRARQAKGMRVNETTIKAIEHSHARSQALAEAIMDPANEGTLIRNTDLGPLIEFSHAERIIEKKLAELETSRTTWSLT